MNQPYAKRCDGRTDPEGVHMDEQVVNGTGSSENDRRIYVGEQIKLGNPNSIDVEILKMVSTTPT